MKKIIPLSLVALVLGLTSQGFAAQQSTSSGVTMTDTSTQSTDAFLVNNAKQPGIVTLADGLQYKVLSQGNGPKPTSNSSVTVDYEGKLTNGQIFDSSYKRGQPATFPVSGVIAGWTEALQLMPQGSTWELYIPSELAYGQQGVPGAIAPNSTLIFKVHLISVNG